MPRISKLFVIWGEPKSGARHVIGHVWREPMGEFGFAYSAAGVREAGEAGFKLLPEFPLVQEYRSRYLFSTFAQRIPSPKRPDYASMLEGWGVSSTDDQLDVLAASGGLQHTDTLELAEYRAPEDELREPLRLRLASSRFFPPSEQLRPDAVLTLQRDRANAIDSNATAFMVESGAVVGYVPRQYAELTARHLDAGHQLKGTVLRRLSVAGDGARWLVEVARAE